MTTIYRTYVEGTRHYEGESLEDAVRAWDAATYRMDRSAAGGVSVASYVGGVQVRDGWVLHVRENGVTYLNPRITVQG